MTEQNLWSVDNKCPDKKDRLNSNREESFFLSIYGQERIEAMLTLFQLDSR